MTAIELAPEAADARYQDGEKRFSVCTLVTDWAQYQAMLESCRAAGFALPDCEFLYLDNRQGNRFDGFAGLNLFLATARGRYIILCHQDVRLDHDNIEKLAALIAEMDLRDPAWAVLGNGGGMAPGRLALRITDPHGGDQRRGDLPAEVSALDENFLVVKRAANLALSRDLGGFHLYGADLCIIADILGYRSYVMDFHLTHLSPGNADRRFHDLRLGLLEKYGRAFRSRWVVNPSAAMFISPSAWRRRIMNSHWGRRLARRARRLRDGWTGGSAGGHD